MLNLPLTLTFVLFPTPSQYDTNDIQPNSDEYEEEEEEPFEGGDRDVEEGSTSVFGVPDYHADDIETEISVTATASSSNSNNVGADGKRRARSISGMTYQGVPIMEESYLNRQQQHNRTRHHPRQYQQHPGQEPHYQQMRQRPEETASPPPQLKLKWDDEGHR